VKSTINVIYQQLSSIKRAYTLCSRPLSRIFFWNNYRWVKNTADIRLIRIYPLSKIRLNYGWGFEIMAEDLEFRLRYSYANSKNINASLCTQRQISNQLRTEKKQWWNCHQISCFVSISNIRSILERQFKVIIYNITRQINYKPKILNLKIWRVLSEFSITAQDASVSASASLACLHAMSAGVPVLNCVQACHILSIIRQTGGNAHNRKYQWKEAYFDYVGETSKTRILEPIILLYYKV